MAMSSRDRRALVILAVVAPALALFFYGKPLLRLASGGSEEFQKKQEEFNSTFQNMRNYPGWQSEIEQKQENLHIAVNHQSADIQKDEFVKAVENLGQKNKVGISRYRWVTVAKKTRATNVHKETMLLDFSASFPALIEFIKGIEALTAPVVVDKINLSNPTGGGAGAGGGGGGGGAGRGSSRQRQGQGQGQGNQQQGLTVSMQLHIYVFPEGEA